MIEVALKFVALLSIVATVPAFIVSIRADHNVFSYLKNAHPQVFEHLGKPSVWGGRLNASSAAVRYISQRKYRSIDDPELQRLGETAHKLQILAISVFVVLVLSVLTESALYH